MLKLNHKVTPDKDVVITELDKKEAVLLHLNTKMYYTLNETGLCIWQMLSSGLTPGEICERFLKEFDVSPEKAKESVLTLINDSVD